MTHIPEPGPSTLPTQVLGGDAPEPGAAPAPRQLGAWRLLRPLGEGGMGMVWLAERADRTFERQAAVKIIRPGFDSVAVHERFLLERQTLGGLEHPHIARLLDAGNTDDGRPYFVMEYVDGMPIDEWCRERSLDLDERVALFLQVCGAVQYAHGRLVVHRDIKPSNILVDAGGQARLLDFGIAKLLPAGPGADAAGLTSASERLLTPQYAAPEQLLGQPVGTPADIYALGMLLYSLLADVLAYSLAGTGPAEMQRLVCEQMPPRPSTRVRDARRARALRGDLDLITLMAMRKEPERRYQTVEQLAADLQRWRDGLPVLAQPDTARYRLRKFVGRNRLALAATALVFLSLVGGIAAALWQAREAERARAVSEQRYQDIRGLASGMMFEVDALVANLPGSSQARRLLVTRAMQYLDRLADETAGDPALAADVATGYFKIAEIQGSPYEANLGDVDGALANARRALALREQAARPAITGDAQRAALARSHMQIGTLIRLKEGNPDSALPAFERALAVLAPRLDAPDRLPDIALAQVDALNLIGDAHSSEGRYPQSRQHHLQALALVDAALAQDRTGEDRVAWQRLQAVSRLRQADAWWWEGGPPDEVIAQMRQAVAELEAILAGDPGNARLTRSVAVASSTFSGVLAYERNVGEARPHIQRALALGERLLGFDPANPQYRRDMARWQVQASDFMSAADFWDEADGHMQRAVALMDTLEGDDPGVLELAAEARTVRCKSAVLRLLAQRDGARSPTFANPAVCASLRACAASLARTGLAAPAVDPAHLEEARAAAGSCPAG